MLDHGFGLEAYGGGACLFGPVGGEETDMVGRPGFEIGNGTMNLVLFNQSGNGSEVVLEVGVAGKLEGEGGQGEVGIGFETGGEGNPTVFQQGGLDGSEFGHEVDDVVGIEGVFHAVPVEVFDLVEQIDYERFFERSVMLVGYPYADFEMSGLSFKTEQFSRPSACV